MLFHPHGPSIHYLPHPEVELIIDFSDALTIVMQITNKSGCIYYLSKDETIIATDSLNSLSFMLIQFYFAELLNLLNAY